RRLGKEGPFRNRSIEENLDLLARMKAGEFPDGARTLRAKIDMSAPNIWLRDPVLYRIRHAEHHHTGNKWCIYPMYDFAHTLSDYIEGITHSVCTLEFEVHRPLYDWLLDSLDLPRPLPHQYEFARLNITYTVMSKRKLMQLVNDGLVNGWDDPRLPTISGLRRRGITASSLRSFAYHIGITKYPSMTDVAVLEHTVREELNRTAQRRLAVLHPIKVVITNYPEGQVEELEAVNNPEDLSAGTREIPFSRELFIVSAAHAIDAEARLYDRLFTVPEPDADGDFKTFINPNSLEVVTAKCEPSLQEAVSELRYQFERLGYFVLDRDSRPGQVVFNRTI